MMSTNDYTRSIEALLQNISNDIGYSVEPATDLEKKRMADKAFRVLDAGNIITDIHKLFSESTYGDKTLLIAITTLNYFCALNTSNAPNFFYAFEETERALNLYVTTTCDTVSIKLDKYYQVVPYLRTAG